jgi:hypothetical protein
MRKFPFLLLSILTTLFGVQGFAQQLPKTIPGLDTGGPKPQVMILGMFHFANPGLDYTKAERDSILSDKRQKEVRDLLDRLKAFKPTKIAIEVPYGTTQVNDNYRLFLQNNFALKESETYQVAFRMAKELNHKTLYPIDWQKGMDFDALLKSARDNGQTKFLERFQQAMGFIQQMQAEANKYTVLEQLRMMNDLEAQERLHSLYILLTEAGKGADYTGADVVAGWYERNLKIAANVVRTADSPDDRVLVLIGAGHLKLLREFLKESPSVEVVESIGYLK